VKRTASPITKPFEIRIGVGMPGFRGMRTVGDPSFIPPTKFRYLQNIRLGAGDVKSRPGLTAFDTLQGPAVWLTEIDDDILPATLYNGPVAGLNEIDYTAVIYPPPETDTFEMITNYGKMDFSRLTQYPPNIQDDEFAPASAIFGLMPAYNKTDGRQKDTGWAAFCMPSMAHPYCATDDETSPLLGTPNTGWDSVEPFSGVLAAGFFQAANCVDPIVRWLDREGNARWLCAGSHRGDLFSGVGNYVPFHWVGPLAPPADTVPASGDPDVGGQPIFEVNFDTKNPFDRYALLGIEKDLFPIVPLYAGALTEVFRMPPPGYLAGSQWYLAPVPNAVWPGAAAFPNCEWVRSMISVGRRADDILTGNEITQETLYIGTVGGKVKAVDGQIAGVADPTTKWGVNDPDDGAVWSYDGVSLVKELDGVGHLVLVAKTGDGGVLACGRTAAYFKEEPGAAWLPVAYSPSFNVPPGVGPQWVEQQQYGFFWMSRADFQGELYFYGIDSGEQIALTPPGFVTWSVQPWRPESLVIYKFDPGTLTMNLVRRGDAFSQAVAGMVSLTSRDYKHTDSGHSVFSDAGGTQSQPVLASDGPALYYVNYWSSIPAGATSYNIGKFDGVTWDDDWATFVPEPGLRSPLDLAVSGQRLWGWAGRNFYRFNADGTWVRFRMNWSFADERGTRLFVGP